MDSVIGVDISEKALDARARRAARAQGYTIRKSRHTSHENAGGFMILEVGSDIPQAGFTYDLSAEGVLEWLGVLTH